MKSKLLMTSMSTIIGMYGLLIFFLLIIFNLTGMPLSGLLIASIIVLAIQFLLAPFFMDLTMKWFYKVKFDQEIPDYLKEFIIKTCNKYNMKYPKIGFIDDGAPNAFTYGRTKNDARIILTRGIFDILTENEVKNVVAHEMGHAIHYDMFLMTAIQIVPLILYYIYDATVSSNDDDDSKGAIIGLIAYILYIISEYIILWFSRTREYYADEFAIIETQDPNSLASALVKIGYGLTTSKNSSNENDIETNTKKRKKTNISTVSALGIFDEKSSKSLVISSFDDGVISKENIKKAARWELWNPWAKWYEFNSTHPLISKRIKSICQYCNQFNQQEFIRFDEQQPESYIDDFAMEVFIKFLPATTFLVLAIIFVLIVDNITNPNLFLGTALIIFSISSFIPYLRSHKNKDYKNLKIIDLLSEVKVSGITSVPCIINGEIIGKGNPGYLFSEDFVIKDDTGIMFVDYKQPLAIFNTLFALLKSKKYMNKIVEIKGWYRRSPVPYIEIHTITMDGITKKCHTYTFNLITMGILIFIGFFLIITSIL